MKSINLLMIAALLLLFIPTIIIFYIYIKLYDGGPALFWQERIGLNGKPFKLVKLRTMKLNAWDIFEKEIVANPVLYNEYLQSNKLENDPRIAGWLSKFLRRTSIDEVPQIINILKGDMNLIGPRPMITIDLQGLDQDTIESIYRVKPGLTGLWQVKGRSAISFKRRIKYDLFYANKRNASLDFDIILKTFKVVLTGKGAY